MLPIEQLPAVLNALCNGGLEEAEAGQLAALLRSDPQARRFYIQYMDMNAALQWMANERAAAGVESEEEYGTEQIMEYVIDQMRASEAERLRREAEATKPQAQPKPTAWSYRQDKHDRPTMRQIVIPKWLFYGGIAAVLALVGTVVTQLVTHEKAASSGNPGTVVDGQTPGGRTNASEIVAMVIATDNAIWGEGSDALRDGHSVYSNRPLALASGRAVLRFANGTEIELEGPCNLQAISASELRLNRGKMVGRSAVQAGTDFVVWTPNARVTDRGTVFGVLVEEDETAKCFVFEGEISIATSSETATLLGGEAARVDPRAQIALVPEDALAFLPTTDLSAATLGVYNYYVQSVLSLEPVAYYRFEDPASNPVVNIAGTRYDASVVGGLEFGGDRDNRSGVFNGNYLYVTAPMEEIAGRDYTVELWVRPGREGLMPLVGFYCGGKRWGGVIETGDRFRFLHRSPAGEHYEIGSNVISDNPPALNRWQHVVAVYSSQGQRLYINGVLVGSTPAPAPLTPAPQLIIGGGDTASSPYSQKEAFVGLLDEIAIYDRSLTRNEIEHHFRLVAGREAGGQAP